MNRSDRECAQVHFPGTYAADQQWEAAAPQHQIASVRPLPAGPIQRKQNTRRHWAAPLPATCPLHAARKNGIGCSALAEPTGNAHTHRHTRTRTHTHTRHTHTHTHTHARAHNRGWLCARTHSCTGARVRTRSRTHERVCAQHIAAGPARRVRAIRRPVRSAYKWLNGYK